MFMCGEIYQNDDGRFQYVCCLCLTTLELASQFELHVLMHHQKDGTKILEPEIKLEEDTPEDFPIAFVDLQPPTQADINTTTVDLKIEQYTDFVDVVKEELITDIFNYPETSIPCEYCDLQFPCQGLKGIHSAQSHAQDRVKSFSCELCTGIFDTKEAYSKHEILHMNYVNPIICPHCNQLQWDRTELILHLNQQLPFQPNTSTSKKKQTRKPKYICERPFVCPTCKRPCRSEKSSKKCELSHTVKDEVLSGTLECDFCGKIFDTLNDFENHIEHHIRRKKNRGRESESMQCDYCKRVYKGYSNFRAHMRSHFQTFKCQFCGREFKSQSQKTAHEHVHRNEQHLCTTCGMNFSLRRQLNVHIRKNHSDPDIRYYCALCPLVFTRKSNLNRHSKTHTAKRSFECKECPKKFCTAKTLRQHSILHNGTKPFLCKYCGTGFSQPAGRRGHEKRVHETVK